MHATIATDWPYLSYPGRLPEPGAFPFPKPKSSAAKHAAKLHAAWAEQHAAVSAVEADLHEAQQTARAAEEALERAFGDLNAEPARTVELTVALEEAKARATEPWIARYRGAILAATAANGAYAAFVDEHLDTLLAELAPDAQAVVNRIADAAQVMRTSLDEWKAVEARSVALVRFAEYLDGRDVPSSPSLPITPADLAAITPDRMALPLPQPERLARRTAALAGEQVTT
jgi:hypothetical protein